jgi:hypothetical protein
MLEKNTSIGDVLLLPVIVIEAANLRFVIDIFFYIHTRKYFCASSSFSYCFSSIDGPG